MAVGTALAVDVEEVDRVSLAVPVAMSVAGAEELTLLLRVALEGALALVVPLALPVEVPPPAA